MGCLPLFLLLPEASVLGTSCLDHPTVVSALGSSGFVLIYPLRSLRDPAAPLSVL
jgi:hypothetical protein